MHSMMLFTGGMSMEKNASMLLPCPCNKNPPESSSCQYSCCTWDSHCLKVACRLQHENNTALSALYPHWLMGVDIFYFRIVKPVTMYLLCILDKLRCRFPTKRHLGIIVYRMSMYQTILIFQLVSQILGQTLVFADQKLHKLL